MISPCMIFWIADNYAFTRAAFVMLLIFATFHLYIYSGTCAIRHLSFPTSDNNLWSQRISIN